VHCRSNDGANIHSSVIKVKKQRNKHVHFYTSRRIEAGEELAWNYGKLFWQNDSQNIV
jgi:SET domain-containing protein